MIITMLDFRHSLACTVWYVASLDCIQTRAASKPKNNIYFKKYNYYLKSPDFLSTPSKWN